MIIYNLHLFVYALDILQGSENDRFLTPLFISMYTVWEQAIISKTWRENFPATKIALSFMA